MTSIDDQRSWSLPDGFKRTEDDPNGFGRLDKSVRDKFAAGGDFQGGGTARTPKDIETEMDSKIEESLTNMSPELKKMLGEE